MHTQIGAYNEGERKHCCTFKTSHVMLTLNAWRHKVCGCRAPLNGKMTYGAQSITKPPIYTESV